MSSKINQQLKLILYPYLFVLKEGMQIRNDYLAYSLMLLQINSREVLSSPAPLLSQENPLILESSFMDQSNNALLPQETLYREPTLDPEPSNIP